MRRAGYQGHITSGAQFPTLAFKEVLEGDFGVDSVVLHDGEDTLVDLVGAIEQGSAVREVAGLAVRGEDGLAMRTAERRMPDDLDAVPFARRYRPHNRHMHVPSSAWSAGADAGASARTVRSSRSTATVASTAAGG